MRSRYLAAPAFSLILALVAGACAGSPSQSGPTGGSAGAGAVSLTVPLPPPDPEAFRDAEAKLRRDGRAKAGLAALGPGAVELATLMDRTASFLLAKVSPALRSLTRPTVPASPGSLGHLASPLSDLGPPGAPVFGTYLMTSVVFNEMISRGQDGDCPCTKTATLDPTTDEVTVDGNKGTIKTTISVRVAVTGSKVFLDLIVKVEGEVRDAKTGAVLYKISNEATGHADGDGCPDASGVAHAFMAFTGHEDHFSSDGSKSGSGVDEGFNGSIRIKVDDNAKTAGVDITANGQGGALLIRLAAQSAAPEFEKFWRSGKCIAVLVSPEGGDVEKDSVTTVTAKVKHKVEGNELDKPVEAKLDGVKTIDPAGSKQKAPATFKYTAGSEDGDRGTVQLESVSNRGIGHASVTFTIQDGWTISSVGTSDERFPPVIANTLKVTIKDLKIKSDKDRKLSGSGTITLTGPITSSAGPLGECRGDLDQTIPVTASGTLVGTGKDAVLRLTLNADAPPGGGSTVVRCPFGGFAPIQNEGYSDRYGETMGQFDLPASAGTTTISRRAAIGGVMNVAATGTFTVARSKK